MSLARNYCISSNIVQFLLDNMDNKKRIIIICEYRISTKQVNPGIKTAKYNSHVCIPPVFSLDWNM